MHSSTVLCTDLYQLTMAEGYWKLGRHQELAVFELYYREEPFQGGYVICCGLETFINAIADYHFKPEYCEYLATLKGSDDKPLFTSDFLQALLSLRLTVDIDAIPEGTLVFSKEPLLRITGPLWQCQLLETLALNLINFASLIATKASRICRAAGGDPVIEFGLRRAQGSDGGLTASRSAFIGGAKATSNVLAGYLYGIPVMGTHAHSWVMSFEDELKAFEAYAKIMPNNCIFLVDTYHTKEGVENAIQVGLKLKKAGYQFLGVRLDSGDLASLSIYVRQRLDEMGFKEAVIVGSNDLDEYAIILLKEKGAKISLWGVGTRLVTAYDQPALGGVYKLAAVQDKAGRWLYKAKKTDDPKKQSIAGIHAVRRFIKAGYFTRDVIYNIDEKEPLPESGETFQDLLQAIFREGNLVYTLPTLLSIQKHCQEQLKKLPEKFQKLKTDEQYRVYYPGKGDSA